MANNNSGISIATMMQRLTSMQDFDVSMLDQLVAAAYDPVSPQRNEANKALMQLQEHPDIWQKADAIMEQSQNGSARFFGLQVLDDAIKTRCVMKERCACFYQSYTVLPCTHAVLFFNANHD
jgi:hypothetical protein